MFKKVDKFVSCGGFQILSFLVAASISTSHSRNTVYYSWGGGGREQTAKNWCIWGKEKWLEQKMVNGSYILGNTEGLYAAPCCYSTPEE